MVLSLPLLSRSPILRRVFPWLDPVPARLRPLLYPVMSAAVLILLRVSIPFPDHVDLVRLIFWTGITLIAAALPVRLPGGIHATITTAPVLAALFDMDLANPFAVCWVAFVGTFELRDLRGEPKWYGTLFNKADFVLSTFAAWLVLSATDTLVRKDDPFSVVAQIVAVGAVFAAVNNGLSLMASSVRTRTP